MLVGTNETSERVADDLNAAFLAFDGPELDLTEFTLLSGDDICPKSDWNVDQRQCESELVTEADNSWIIIMLASFGFVLMATLFGTIYFFVRQEKRRPKPVNEYNLSHVTIYVISDESHSSTKFTPLENADTNSNQSSRDRIALHWRRPLQFNCFSRLQLDYL